MKSKVLYTKNAEYEIMTLQDRFDRNINITKKIIMCEKKITKLELDESQNKTKY